MRALVLLLSLATLAACASDDAAVDSSPETAPDEVQSVPIVAPGDPGLAPDADAPAADAPPAGAPTPTTAPPPPLAPVEAVPAAPDPPDGEHIMDDGTEMHGDMPMDEEHRMDGTPMDHGDHSAGHDG